MERVTGIEPVSSAWKADVLAIVRYPHRPGDHTDALPVFEEIS